MFDLLVSPLVQVIALGVTSIVIWHLQGRGRPNGRLVVQIAFFLTMTAIMVGNGISPFKSQPIQEVGGTLIAAKILWWVHLAWSTIGFIRIYIVLDGRPLEARLLQDLFVAVVYLGVTLSILSFVFGIAIGTLVATSGVIAIILGLALQSTLNDVFSGVALTLGRPYGIGDWIILADGVEGRVVENTWRSTHVLTPANNIVVLPNSVLAKVGLTNITRPDETHQQVLTLRVRATHPPSFVAEVMRRAMIGANYIVHDPAPIVALKGVDAMAVEVELQYRVRHPADRTPARNELIDLVYRQCAAMDLSLALPTTASVLTESAVPKPASAETAKDLLQTSPIFADLKPEELAKLEAAARARRYRSGELVLDRAESSSSVMLVRSGAVAAYRQGAEVTRLGCGAIFGQTDAIDGEPTTFEALTGVEAYEIDSLAVKSLLRDNPNLQTDLARHLCGLAGDARVGHGPAEGKRAFLRRVHGFLGR
ncbi:MULTISPECIES: mechanosensitive ion channel family protein [unclassified Sinorhizobium]|uniref:mechanosensitive ion channel family protein n=1 Tax=unclassified Sinorhizobium TaxID=2613772 RepID=UPI0024C2C413|nr:MULTISPECIES: mechanosensitive ion channel family protein [unclassified Sinorhizobium]MDK1373503.1 mechanosensitive ion channel family protein [Sinorhizobium sp. 6-70]MDK1479738.1 mechanosensitive ion channel family protein [Sinorhizobium sp. 6-117]